MLDGEKVKQYKEIPGFFGYRVGNDGSVWTRRKKGGNNPTFGRLNENWKLMKIHYNSDGYCAVNLDRNGRNHRCLVHRLVLEVFIGPCPRGMEACHYPDADKTNNHLENLRWDTHKENAKDRYRDRLPIIDKCCRRCGKIKLLDEFCKDKRSVDGHGQRCRRCCTQVETDRLRRDPQARAKRRIYNRLYMRKWKKKGREVGVGSS